jgi:hypothetical protein
MLATSGGPPQGFAHERNHRQIDGRTKIAARLPLCDKSSV